MQTRHVSSGFFTLPDTPAGGPVFLRLFVSNRLSQAFDVPYIVETLEHDGEKLVVSEGTIDVPAGGVGILELDQTAGDLLAGLTNVRLTLPDAGLLPSLAVAQRFLADQSTNLLLWIAPAQFSDQKQPRVEHELVRSTSRPLATDHTAQRTKRLRRPRRRRSSRSR